MVIIFACCVITLGMNIHNIPQYIKQGDNALTASTRIVPKTDIRNTERNLKKLCDCTFGAGEYEVIYDFPPSNESGPRRDTRWKQTKQSLQRYEKHKIWAGTPSCPRMERLNKDLKEALRTVRAKEDTQKTEWKLKRQCDNTLGTGVFEVYFEFPPPAESNARRKLRWDRMREKLHHYEDHETRAALTLQRSGTRIKRLMVSLDNLLNQFDEKLAVLGAEPSRLREQLWECYHQAHSKKTELEV